MTPLLQVLLLKIQNSTTTEKKMPIYDRNFPIAFSSDSNLFAFVSSPHTVTISDINTGKTIAELTGHTAPLHSLLFSPCGQYLAGANLGATVQIWDIQSESLVMEPTTYEGNRVRLAYTADSTLAGCRRSWEQSRDLGCVKG